MKRRYGKLSFSDHFTMAIGSIILCIIASGSLILRFLNISTTPYMYGIGIIIVCVFWNMAILIPYSERFEIRNDKIISQILFRTAKIDIPDNISIVISYLDNCPHLARRSAAHISQQVFIPEGKYMVSILKQISTPDLLEKLHRPFVNPYTNSTVMDSFCGQFIYSFIWDHALLDRVMQNRNCNIVIPKSLSNRLVVSASNAEIIIDDGY